MKKENNNRNLIISLYTGALGLVALTLVEGASGSTPPRTSLDDQPPRMISAFFGLDNAIQAPRFKGADGMPVTFSRRVKDPNSIDPNAFTVVTRSGARAHPLQATTRPADEVSKRHTVLLIGEFENPHLGGYAAKKQIPIIDRFNLLLSSNFVHPGCADIFVGQL